MKIHVQVWSLTVTGEELEALNKRHCNDKNRKHAIRSDVEKAHINIISIEAIPEPSDNLSEYMDMIHDGLYEVKDIQYRQYSQLYAGELEGNNPDNFPVYHALLLFAHPGILRPIFPEGMASDD